MTPQLNFLEDSSKRILTLDGFRYEADIISPAHEQELIDRFRKLPFREFEFHGYLGKRRVVSFGWQYDYSGRQLRKGEDIPEYLVELRARAAAFAGLEEEMLQQVLVTEYAGGTGIGWHRDKSVFGEVVGISLLAPCVLRFRKKNGPKWDRVNVPVERRSAYHLSGPARSVWEHSIFRVNELRYAVTFRNVLSE